MASRWGDVKYVFAITLVLLLLCSPVMAQQKQPSSSSPQGTEEEIQQRTSSAIEQGKTDVTNALKNGWNWFTFFLESLLMLAIIYRAFLLITATNEQRASEIKSSMKYLVIGFAMIICFDLILSLVFWVATGKGLGGVIVPFWK